MNAPALGEAATQLPWLFPGASTLVALARAAPASTWEQVCLDPGGVLLVLRQTAPATPSSLASLLLRTEVLDGAVRITDYRGAGFVNWNHRHIRTVYQSAIAYARAARALAETTGRADPDAAWCAALLAPLGWMALGAIAAGAVTACLESSDFPSDPYGAQQRLWGMDQGSVGRRLCRRWGLPAWIAVVIGHLDLAVEHAEALGADGDLFRIVQLAVASVEANPTLRLSVGVAAEENARVLGIATETVAQLQPKAAGQVGDAEARAQTWDAPESMPLLRDLLLLAAEKRRLSEAPVLMGLENDIDHLHQALREQRRTEGSRLHAHKLAALAEFAAGAGHEINNPLAVISGQAQYLLNHEPDPARQRSLQTVVAQTKRIHQILSELMLFARPPKPKKQILNAAAVTHEVVDTLGELASQRRVTLCYTPPAQPLMLYADPKQIQTAIMCLLRNAVEAAPVDGWASVHVEVAVARRIEWIIEDSGPGPSSTRVEHLFDPFYSGRQAGRGRGLGLPTAWQLARNHGGDVVYAGAPAGHTRFVLSLPLEPIPRQLPEAAPVSTPVVSEGPLQRTVPLNGHCAVSLDALD